MFLPLRDANPTKKTPVITITLIGITIGVFFGQKFLEVFTGGLLVNVFGCRPDLLMDILNLKLINIIFLPQLFSYMFLHADFFHLLGNLWFLWIFGDNVEDRLGKWGFLVFYLMSGIIAALSHILTNTSSNIPMIGASGAIAGVLGAYFVFYPKAKVTTLIFVIIRKLPAFIFLGIWLAMQIFYSILHSGKPGVAWYAHIGGFIFGAIFAFVAGKKR